MQFALPVHVVAGGLALAFGYLALYSAKGATRHRRSGILFVYAMLTMASFGALITVVRNAAPSINIPAAVLSSYLVITALLTVRPAPAGRRWLDRGLMLVALVVGTTSLAFGFQAIASPAGAKDGIPAFPFFMFGVVGLIAGLSDLRMIRSGGLMGAARLARHLWRMCFGLFIAAMSFFIGQAKVIPEAIRIPGLLVLPVLVVLVTMLYWLWRVRVRGSLRGIVRASATT